jgi:hypothetical protein
MGIITDPDAVPDGGTTNSALNGTGNVNPLITTNKAAISGATPPFLISTTPRICTIPVTLGVIRTWVLGGAPLSMAAHGIAIPGDTEIVTGVPGPAAKLRA